MCNLWILNSWFLTDLDHIVFKRGYRGRSRGGSLKLASETKLFHFHREFSEKINK